MMLKLPLSAKWITGLVAGVSVSLLLAGCLSQDIETQRANTAALRSQGGTLGSGAQGRAVPPLSGAERALYEKAVALYRSDRNNPVLFDTAGAIPCELNERTQYLLAAQVSKTAFDIFMRRSDLAANTKTRMEPLQVSVLSGKCADGRIEGPFDVVTRLVMDLESASGVQRMVTSQRVRGTMTDGEINGPLSIARRIEMQGMGAHPFWVFSQAVFKDSEQTGPSVIYNELPQFNLTIVLNRLSNGFLQTRSFNGSELSAVSTTFQGQLYGPMLVYMDGKPVTPTTFFWAGRPVTNPDYMRTPLTKPLVASVGVGMAFPDSASGPFEISDVVYPSPAADAGLLPRDRVVAIGGQTLNATHNAGAIRQMLAGAEGGEVTVSFVREGESSPRTVTVTRGSFKSPQPGR